MAVCIAIVLFGIVDCGNHIVQRAVEDYFQYHEGNWWQLVGTSDTMYVEVEPADTVLQKHVMPVSYNGIARMIHDADEALYEFISVEYTFAGSPFTVINDFAVFIELPMVKGNTWRDSLIDSLEVSGQVVHATYHVWGIVSDCAYDERHGGDVYTIELNSVLSVTSPDTAIIDSSAILEEYAPGTGVVRFRNETDDYLLDEYIFPE